MSAADALSAEKAALRQELKQRRASLPAAERALHSAAIAERLFELEAVRQGQRFFCYISYGTEVDTHAILKRLLAEGKAVAVPRIMGTERMEALCFESWQDLAPGQLGILTPTGNRLMPDPFDVAITPGLGFTEQGQRIGFGRGYYDRWFASHQVGLRVALGFEIQLLERIPTDEHDIRVQRILTERRVIVTG